MKHLAPLALCLSILVTAQTARAQGQGQSQATSQQTDDQGQFSSYPQTRGQLEVFRSGFIPSWIELDGELRGRLEGQSAISDRSGVSAAYFLTRIRAGIHVKPNQHVEFYLQVHDVHALGLPLSQTSSNMRDTVDFRQGYLKLKTHALELIVGRQDLRFGSERLIGVSDFTNTARSFDAADLRVGTKNRVDFFTASVVNIYPTSLDRQMPGLTFHGAYATLDRVIPGLSLQPLLLASTAGTVKDYLGNVGSKVELTFGGELSGRISHRWDIDGLLAIQRGTYGRQSISAGAGFMKVAYALPGPRWPSRVGLEYDYATGDSHSRPGTRGTFDQQYPSNHNAFGLVDLFGFQNIRQERVNIDVAPSKALAFLIQAGRLSLANLHDGIYTSSGSTYKTPPSSGFSSGDIGYEVDISAKYLIGDDLVINAGFGHLLSSSPYLASASNAYLSFTYRFSVLHRQ